MNPTKRLKVKNTKIATHPETNPERTQEDEAGPGKPSPTLARPSLGNGRISLGLARSGVLRTKNILGLRKGNGSHFRGWQSGFLTGLPGQHKSCFLFDFAANGETLLNGEMNTTTGAARRRPSRSQRPPGGAGARSTRILIVFRIYS